MASSKGQQKAESAGLRDLSPKADAILDDKLDPIDDLGRSQSQLERAKATKLQATDESRAHVAKFEAIITTQESGLAKVFDAKISKIKKRNKHLRVTMASMVLAGSILQSGQIGTPATGSTTHAASTTILKRVNTFLDGYGIFAQPGASGLQPSPSAEPSRRDEDTFTALLQTQHGRATQRIRALMDSEISGSTHSIAGSMVSHESDEIWASFGECKSEERKLTDGQSQKRWDEITNPACRGVRRIAKGLPEHSVH
ncbi:MAG: hypothetical protein Q9207_003888 [Kuettlingeria erythrocarpa]